MGVGGAGGSTYVYQSGSPYAHYKFSEASGNLIDAGSAAEDLAWAGSPAYQQSGPISGGYSINPTAAASSAGPTTSFSFAAADSFVVVMWMYVTNTASATRVFFQCDSDSGGSGTGRIQLSLSNTGKTYAYVIDDSGNASFKNIATQAEFETAASSDWCQLTWIADRDDGKYYCYVNGVETTLSGQDWTAVVDAITLDGLRIINTNDCASYAECWVNEGKTWTNNHP